VRIQKYIILLLVVLVAAGLSAGLVGCGDEETTTTQTQATAGTETTAGATGTSAGGSTGTSEAGGNPDAILRSMNLVNSMVVNFSPFANQPNWPTVCGIYEPMLVYNKLTQEQVPWLADSYEYSDDLMTLTFKLHPGILWSDGQPFTANDVVYTFDLLKNSPGLQGPGVQALAGSVDTVTAPDDSTVVFGLRYPDSMAVYDVGSQNIVPEHIWKDVANPAQFGNEKPVGTGPFTELTEFQAQSYVILKNPNYWREKGPSFAGIRVTAYPGNEQLAAAMVAGDLDWVSSVQPNIEQAVIAKNPEISYVPNPTSMTVLMHLNPNTKPLDDVVVRKAMSMAINRDQILQVAFNGKAFAADVTGLSNVYADWKVDDPSSLGDWTTYNPDKAGQMLDEAGYNLGSDGVRAAPDGTPLTFKLTMVQGFTDWISAGEIMVQNWKDVGINVETKMIDPGAYFSSIPVGDYEISLWFGYTDPTPYGQYLKMMGSATVVPWGQFTMVNFAHYGSPAADALLKQWAATEDKAQQLEACRGLQKVFADEAPEVPLWSGLDWGIFNNATFTGWPSEADNYALGFCNGAVNPEQLLIMMRINAK